MTQDEIIEMPPYLNASYEGDDLYTGDQMRKYAKLLAAKEREACAKVCEEIRNKYSGLGDSAERVAVEWCLETIRARGEQS